MSVFFQWLSHLLWRLGWTLRQCSPSRDLEVVQSCVRVVQRTLLLLIRLPWGDWWHLILLCKRSWMQVFRCLQVSVLNSGHHRLWVLGRWKRNVRLLCLRALLRKSRERVGRVQLLIICLLALSCHLLLQHAHSDWVVRVCSLNCDVSVGELVGLFWRAEEFGRRDWPARLLHVWIEWCFLHRINCVSFVFREVKLAFLQAGVVAHGLSWQLLHVIIWRIRHVFLLFLRLHTLRSVCNSMRLIQIVLLSF